MTISILFIGDIVGEPGRDAVAELLPGLMTRFSPDIVIANAENATHGHGIQENHYRQLRKLGIDAMTMGDHVWNNADVIPLLGKSDEPIVRPANYPAAVPGKRFVDLTVKGKRLRLINLMGRVFMGAGAHLESPFEAFDELAAALPKPDVIVVDMHAEATSEKRGLAEHIAGRAQLVVGTHTHVPTADAQILPSGTAFISDLGMTGPTDSSLGADKKEVLKNFLTGLPWRYSVATGQCELGAVFCTINLETGRAEHIEHVREFTSAT